MSITSKGSKKDRRGFREQEDREGDFGYGDKIRIEKGWWGWIKGEWYKQDADRSRGLTAASENRPK